MKNILLLLVLFLPVLGVEKENLIGEYLAYQVEWQNFLPVGSASLSFQTDGGRYYIRYTGKTNNFGDIFKKLDKEGVAYVDPDSLLPNLVTHRNLVENDYSYERWQITQGKSVVYQDMPEDPIAYSLSSNVFDILSGLMQFRVNILAQWSPSLIGDTTSIQVIKRTEYVTIPITYKGIGQCSINGKAVTVQRFEIGVGDLSRLLFGSRANLLISFSTDEYHLPLKMESETIFGNLVAELNLDKSNLPYNYP